MCTRFVYNGKDTITGFNFDIDLSVWDHKIIKEKDRFYIGIKMPDNRYCMGSQNHQRKRPVLYRDKNAG